MATKPAYTFELPSLDDATVLNVRIYHPARLSNILWPSGESLVGLQGVVIAHPYAPLGGSYDDHVVLAVVQAMLEHGFVVLTFNFRGAGTSQGRTSWTGQGETADYISVVGCLFHYLQNLENALDETSRFTDRDSNSASRAPPMQLLLAGYSYGSLILARLPPVSTILQRFEDAVLGTILAEIILRARTLAKQTRASLLTGPSGPRGRSLSQSDAAGPTPGRARAATITVGGDETTHSPRRCSGSGRSSELVRRSLEAPQRIVAHVRRRSGSYGNSVGTGAEAATMMVQTSAPPVPRVRYLLISPVLLPYTNLLLPPGLMMPALGQRRSTTADVRAGAQLLLHPTLAMFGTADSFTNIQRLRAWAERQATNSEAGLFRWEQIDGAGHFWQEADELRALQGKIVTWMQD